MTGVAVVCLVWLGMVLGISFLETPVKFTAPSVTLPIGLDVGRHVFGAFNKVEVAWVILACAFLLRARPPRRVWAPGLVAIAIVALQTSWLRPVLDERVGMILRGEVPPEAPYHLLYVVLEVLKAASLAAAGAASLRALQQAGRDERTDRAERSTEDATEGAAQGAAQGAAEAAPEEAYA